MTLSNLLKDKTLLAQTGLGFYQQSIHPQAQPVDEYFPARNFNSERSANSFAVKLAEKKPRAMPAELHRKEVLVDTDILVSIFKADDSNHAKAMKICNEFQVKGVEFILSPFTMFEAATVISYKVSHEKAICFVKEMKEINLSVYTLLPEHLELAEKWFFKQTGRGISYFDCYNMALLERYKNQLDGIFSFDEIYKKNGFKTLSQTKIAPVSRSDS